MRAILTGATGFIGRALCEELFRRNIRITAIVRRESKNSEKLPGYVNIVESSLDDIDFISGAYDVFYHLAWNGAGGNDREDFGIQSVNIKYTGNMLRLAQRLGCKRFVGAGSQAEYGRIKGLCREDTLPSPFMMYGAAKLAAYNMGRVLAGQLGIEFVWPRIYSVYGAGESPCTLMSYVVESLIKGSPPELSLCDNMWDFLYITDCARALADLGDINKPLKGIYNISYGEPRILREFVDAAAEIINPLVRPVYGARLTDESRTFWLEPDVTKLKSIPFIPEISFSQGIVKKYEDIRSRFLVEQHD